MKITSNPKTGQVKIQFSKDDHILYCGDWISNGHFMLNIRHRGYTISFSNPVAKDCYAHGHTFEQYLGSFKSDAQTCANMASAIEGILKCKVKDLLPATITNVVLADDFQSDEPLDVRILKSEGKPQYLNNAYVKLLGALHEIQVSWDSPFVIGLYCSEPVVYLMKVHAPHADRELIEKLMGVIR